MIEQVRLNSLLEKYGIDSKRISKDKYEKLVDGANYGEVVYVLDFLRDRIGIDPKRIELCPSILYYGIDNIKENYNFLSSVGFNLLKLNNCLHILNSNPKTLKSTYDYVLENYGAVLIDKYPSVLSASVNLFKEIEDISDGRLSNYFYL